MRDFFEGHDDFMDDEYCENDSPDQLHDEAIDFSEPYYQDFGWDDIAFLGVQAKKIAKDETKRKHLEYEIKKYQDKWYDL